MFFFITQNDSYKVQRCLNSVLLKDTLRSWSSASENYKILHLNVLSTLKKTLQKNCNGFTVFQILSCNSRRQAQNVRKLMTLYSEKVPCKGPLLKSANRD